VREISAAAILEKNKLAAAGAWLLLCEITPAGEEPIRLARNSANVVWPSVGGPPWTTWTAYPFSLDPTTEDGTGRVPSARLRVSNVARLLEYYLQASGGLDGATVTLRLVHSAHLDLTVPERVIEFEVLGAATDAHWATLELGLPNPLAKRFPSSRYNPRYCRWHFRDAACGFILGTITRTTISFTAPSLITDSGGGFATGGFLAGRRVRVSGSATNDGEYVTDTVNDTELVVEDTSLASEGAGETVTVEVICPKTLDLCLVNGRGAWFGGSPGVEKEGRL